MEATPIIRPTDAITTLTSNSSDPSPPARCGSEARTLTAAAIDVASSPRAGEVGQDDVSAGDSKAHSRRAAGGRGVVQVGPAGECRLCHEHRPLLLSGMFKCAATHRLVSDVTIILVSYRSIPMHSEACKVAKACSNRLLRMYKQRKPLLKRAGQHRQLPAHAGTTAKAAAVCGSARTSATSRCTTCALPCRRAAPYLSMVTSSTTSPPSKPRCKRQSPSLAASAPLAADATSVQAPRSGAEIVAHSAAETHRHSAAASGGRGAAGPGTRHVVRCSRLHELERDGCGRGARVRTRGAFPATAHGRQVQYMLCAGPTVCCLRERCCLPRNSNVVCLEESKLVQYCARCGEHCYTHVCFSALAESLVKCSKPHVRESTGTSGSLIAGHFADRHRHPDAVYAEAGRKLSPRDKAWARLLLTAPQSALATRSPQAQPRSETASHRSSTCLHPR